MIDLLFKIWFIATTFIQLGTAILLLVGVGFLMFYHGILGKLPNVIYIPAILGLTFAAAYLIGHQSGFTAADEMYKAQLTELKAKGDSALIVLSRNLDQVNKELADTRLDMQQKQADSNAELSKQLENLANLPAFTATKDDTDATRIDKGIACLGAFVPTGVVRELNNVSLPNVGTKPTAKGGGSN